MNYRERVHMLLGEVFRDILGLTLDEALNRIRFFELPDNYTEYPAAIYNLVGENTDATFTGRSLLERVVRVSIFSKNLNEAESLYERTRLVCTTNPHFRFESLVLATKAEEYHQRTFDIAI